MSSPSKYGHEFSILFILFLLVFFAQQIVQNFDLHIRYLVLQFADLEAAILHLPKHPLCNLSLQEVIDIKPPWSTIKIVLDHASYVFSLLTLFLIIILTFFLQRKTVTESYKRIFNMESLLSNNLSSCPCIAPIVNWGSSILDEPLDSGPWMAARNPLQFAASNNLIVHASKNEDIAPDQLLTSTGLANCSSPILTGKIPTKLNRDKAKEIFAKQLLPLYDSWDKLPDYLLALGTAFILFGFNRKEEAAKILDQMSLSFRKPYVEHGWKWQGKYPFFKRFTKNYRNYKIDTNLTLSKKELANLWNNPDILKVIAPHNKYESLVLLALYAFARRKGVLNTAEFIWLRVVNRTLFYLCNNWGRRTCWVEVAGAWAHFNSETALSEELPNFTARDLGEKKFVGDAVKELEDILADQGWINAA